MFTQTCCLRSYRSTPLSFISAGSAVLKQNKNDKQLATSTAESCSRPENLEFTFR